MIAQRLALSCALALVMVGSAVAQPPVWTASSKTCRITLFGSVHVLPEGLDWEPQALSDALAAAQELWFEIPIDAADQQAASNAAMARGLLPADDQLSRHLSPQGAARLKALAPAAGLSVAQVERLQPWFAELALTLAFYQRQGGRMDQGVEQRLAQTAPKAERKAFETPLQQITLFADAAQSDQIASLEDTLMELDTDPGAYKRLIADWLKGDMSEIEREDIAPLRDKAPGLYRTLLADRNQAWTQTLSARLQQPCTGVVVVVGAAHLIGPGGVPALLKARGFEVTGP